MRKLTLLLAIFLTTTITVAASLRNIVINEIAWMGTAASTADEWIELKNTTSVEIDLTGWMLTAEDGTPSIELAGSIAAESFFLIERTDNNSVFGILADQIYFGALGNDGEVLILKNSADEEIDRVNAWYAGENDLKASMERVDPTADGTDSENWANNDGDPINGLDANENPLSATPRTQNSVYFVPNLPENQTSATPTNLLPENESFTNSREFSALFSDPDGDSGSRVPYFLE